MRTVVAKPKAKEGGGAKLKEFGKLTSARVKYSGFNVPGEEGRNMVERGHNFVPSVSVEHIYKMEQVTGWRVEQIRT